jgi:hypothetical protein
MASGVYNQFKSQTLKKLIDLSADTIKVALLDSSHAFDADSANWSSVSANEVSGAGYSAGGNTLASLSVIQDDSNDRAKWDADDSTWSSATITAAHAVIYDDTATDDPLICSIDFGGNQSVAGGDFTIAWSATGILLLA